jgi:hypothetical protein
MRDTLKTKNTSAASRSQPDRRKSTSPGQIVSLGDEIWIQMEVPEQLTADHAKAAKFVMEGMASFGSKLLGVVEDAEDGPPAELAAPLGEASSRAARQMLAAFDGHQQQIIELSAPRQRSLARTFEDVACLLLEAAYGQDVSTKQLDEQGRAAVDTLRLLVGGGADRLETLIDALESPAVEGYADISEEEAEARARLRLHALYQRVIRDSFTVSELTQRVGISRQRLKQLRDQDRLFAIEVPFQRGMLYPRWQFGIADGKPRAQMPQLIAAAREGGLDAISFHILINNAAAGGGLSPLDLLEAGEERRVLRILRGADQ